MRMWMVPTEMMCRKHLLGEHVEIHMLVTHLNKKRKITNFIKKNQLEPSSVISRHQNIINEMQKRNYNHQSPIIKMPDTSYLPDWQRNYKVNVNESLCNLMERCPECKKKMLRV